MPTRWPNQAASIPGALFAVVCLVGCGDGGVTAASPDIRHVGLALRSAPGPQCASQDGEWVADFDGEGGDGRTIQYGVRREIGGSTEVVAVAEVRLFELHQAEPERARNPEQIRDSDGWVSLVESRRDDGDPCFEELRAAIRVMERRDVSICGLVFRESELFRWHTLSRVHASGRSFVPAESPGDAAVMDIEVRCDGPAVELTADGELEVQASDGTVFHAPYQVQEREVRVALGQTLLIYRNAPRRIVERTLLVDEVLSASLRNRGFTDRLGTSVAAAVGLALAIGLLVFLLLRRREQSR